jgi:hypothetical protein
MADRLVRWLPLAMVCGLLAWVSARAARPISDPDDWWHLRLGNDLIAQHSLSAPDHWSSFATVTWVPTEPLPEVASAYVERWLGLPGLAWLFGVAAMVVVVVVYLANRRDGRMLSAGVATVLAVLASSGSLTSRPQLVSFVLLPVLVAAWLQSERDLRPRWWLIPMAWFWSLCHGFWFIGVAYGFLFVLGIALSRRATAGQVARLAAVAVGSFAVVLLNPIGPGVLEAPFAVSSTSSYIQEWDRTDLLLTGPLGAAAMIAGVALVWILTRRGVTSARVLVLVAAAFWLWYAGRTVVIAGLTTAPLFTAALEVLLTRYGAPDTTDRPVRPGRIELRALAGSAVALLAILAVLVPHTSATAGGVAPGLDGRLDRLPPGTKVFNAYELGGWIHWRHPDLDPYIDGLITPYSSAHAAAYERAATVSPGWYAVVQDSAAPVALLSTGSALATLLEGRGWISAGESDGYVLLQRP